MLYGILKFLHVAAMLTWVGGMFFAYMVLRPVAAELLQAPDRLQLWRGVFGRFFPWVWGAVALILASGFGMIFDAGDMSTAPLYVHAMLGLGLVMMLIFAHVFFAPYRRLKHQVDAQNWADAGKALAQIRMLVGINTLLGFIVVFIASHKLFA